MTPPSADDQTEPSSGFPAWSLQTEVARLRELLRQREKLLEEALAELTRLRALDQGREQEIDRLDNKIDLLRGEATRLRAERDDLKEATTSEEMKASYGDLIRQYTALLIDLRALVERWEQHRQEHVMLSRKFNREGHQVLDAYNDGKAMALGDVLSELTARLSRESHQDTPQ